MMKTTFSISLIIFTVFAFNVRAQEIIINTDRPDQSDGVSTVPKRLFQIEEGVTFRNKTALNNLMFRYGLTNTTEVRLLFDAGKVFNKKGVLPLSVSFKQELIDEQKIIPAITLVGYLSYDQLASKDFRGDEVNYEIKLAFENTLSNQLSLGYNIGTSNNFKNWDVSTGLGYTPFKKTAFFIEYFSVFSTSMRPEHNIDIGMMYLIKNNLQVDLAFGHAIFTKDDRFYTTFGVSYLLL